MNRQNVVIVNWTRISDDDLKHGLSALQMQVSNDFAPVWGRDATLIALSRSARGGSAAWQAMEPGRMEARPSNGSYPDSWALILLDKEPDEAGADSPSRVYRDRTRTGRPLTKVFVNRVPKGNDWCHAASRALLDMLADPYGCTTVYHRAPGEAAGFYAQTVCEPVAAYADGYECAGRRVSNFTHPAYWSDGPSGPGDGVKFDERGQVARAFQILPGGALGFYDCKTATWCTRDSSYQDGPTPPGTAAGQRNSQPEYTIASLAAQSSDPGPTGALYPP